MRILHFFPKNSVVVYKILITVSFYNIPGSTNPNAFIRPTKRRKMGKSVLNRKRFKRIKIDNIRQIKNLNTIELIIKLVCIKNINFE